MRLAILFSILATIGALGAYVDRPMPDHHWPNSNRPTYLDAPTGTTRILTIHRGRGRCQEDEPCWRWRYMGNRRRGIRLSPGYSCKTYGRGTSARCIVNGRGFDRARADGAINRAKTPTLPSDRP